MPEIPKDIFDMIEVVERFPAGEEKISSENLLNGLAGSRSRGYLLINRAQVLRLLDIVGYLESQGRGAPQRLYTLTELGKLLRDEDGKKLREIYEKYGAVVDQKIS